MQSEGLWCSARFGRKEPGPPIDSHCPKRAIRNSSNKTKTTDESNRVGVINKLFALDKCFYAESNHKMWETYRGVNPNSLTEFTPFQVLRALEGELGLEFGQQYFRVYTSEQKRKFGRENRVIIYTHLGHEYVAGIAESSLAFLANELAASDLCAEIGRRLECDNLPKGKVSRELQSINLSSIDMLQKLCRDHCMPEPRFIFPNRSRETKQEAIVVVNNDKMEKECKATSYSRDVAKFLVAEQMWKQLTEESGKIFKKESVKYWLGFATCGDDENVYLLLFEKRLDLSSVPMLHNNLIPQNLRIKYDQFLSSIQPPPSCNGDLSSGSVTWADEMGREVETAETTLVTGGAPGENPGHFHGFGTVDKAREPETTPFRYNWEGIVPFDPSKESSEINIPSTTQADQPNNFARSDQPKTSAELIEVRPKTAAELIEVRPKASAELTEVRPKTAQLLEVRPKTSVEVTEVRPKTSAEVTEVRPKKSARKKSKKFDRRQNLPESGQQTIPAAVEPLKNSNSSESLIPPLTQFPTSEIARSEKSVASVGVQTLAENGTRIDIQGIVIYAQAITFCIVLVTISYILNVFRGFFA